MERLRDQEQDLLNLFRLLVGRDHVHYNIYSNEQFARWTLRSYHPNGPRFVDVEGSRNDYFRLNDDAWNALNVMWPRLKYGQLRFLGAEKIMCLYYGNSKGHEKYQAWREYFRIKDLTDAQNRSIAGIQQAIEKVTEIVNAHNAWDDRYNGGRGPQLKVSFEIVGTQHEVAAPIMPEL